ncbi:MAG: hypothetical protein WD801_00075 [Gemmatimonadaceae bacterium]
MSQIPRVLTSAKGAILTAVVAVGLAASVGARAPATDFVSVFDHPKLGFCYVNLYIEKKEKEPKGTDAAEEAEMGRNFLGTFGDFRGIRPIGVARQQGMPTCDDKPKEDPPKEELPK